MRLPHSFTGAASDPVAHRDGRQKRLVMFHRAPGNRVKAGLFFDQGTLPRQGQLENHRKKRALLPAPLPGATGRVSRDAARSSDHPLVRAPKRAAFPVLMGDAGEASTVRVSAAAQASAGVRPFKCRQRRGSSEWGQPNGRRQREMQGDDRDRGFEGSREDRGDGNDRSGSARGGIEGIARLSRGRSADELRGARPKGTADADPGLELTQFSGRRRHRRALPAPCLVRGGARSVLHRNPNPMTTP